MRHGDWKLITGEKDRIELYDLAHDPSETTNLAEREPQRVAELRKFMELAAAADDDARVMESAK